MNKFLSASLMCADLTDIINSVKELEKAGIDYLHIDIMDGAFVPNITLGFDFVNVVKKITDIPLDVHMMVNEPSRFIDRMNLGKDDILCIHYEAEKNLEKALESIRKKGCKVGLAINPTTSVDAVKDYIDKIDMLLVMTVTPGFAGQKMFAEAEEKVTYARSVIGENILIQVDGNISPENGRKLYKCGADIFVLGTSALFMKDKSLVDAANDFIAYLE